MPVNHTLSGGREWLKKKLGIGRSPFFFFNAVSKSSRKAAVKQP
jgi:hypothetical protein